MDRVDRDLEQLVRDGLATDQDLEASAEAPTLR
jgi:hypothetical protein